MTIPIALLMGLYLRRVRPGKVLETSLLGFVLVMLAIWGGQWASQTPAVGGYFTLTAPALVFRLAAGANHDGEWRPDSVGSHETAHSRSGFRV